MHEPFTVTIVYHELASWTPVVFDMVNRLTWGSSPKLLVLIVLCFNPKTTKKPKERRGEGMGGRDGGGGVGGNGPFAASGHMVQNPPCWRASCPLGHPEKRLHQEKFAFSLFWMSQCIACSPAWWILYHVTASCKGLIN